MLHVRVTKNVRQDLGTLGLSREGVVKALTGLHAVLPLLAEDSRTDRYPGEEAACFAYSHVLPDQGLVWTLLYAVYDADWPSEVWVVGVRGDSNPLR